MKSIALLNRLLVVVALVAIVFQIGCETKDAAVVVPDPTESKSMQPAKKSVPPAGYDFETPVRLKAGDEFVAVEAPGYACPTLADVDEDGKLDLVVGQFNNGHMQFCKNVAEDGEPPKFAAAEWIQSGDERAEVPGVW